MKPDESAPIRDDVKSRMEHSVPTPNPGTKLTEEDRRGLELQGEVEHAQGERREEISERAAKITGSEEG